MNKLQRLVRRLRGKGEPEPQIKLAVASYYEYKNAPKLSDPSRERYERGE